MKKRRAFSLIELSIVLVIIGILIGAAASSVKLVFTSKISAAQSFTKGSPVSSIPGLLLWLEPVMKESFIASEAINGTSISTWKDSNTQSVSKNDVSRTADSNVKYVSQGINDLPSVYFSGTDLTNDVGLSGSALSFGSQGFTFFVVAKSDENSSSQARYVFRNGDASNGFGYWKDSSNLRNSGIDGNSALGGTIPTTAEVITVKYDAEQSLINLYVNGTKTVDSTSLTLSNCSSSCALVIGNSLVGSNLPWKGFISEIIVFDGSLKDLMRHDVEVYLGKKYRVRISS